MGVGCFGRMQQRGRRVGHDAMYHVLHRGDCRTDLFEKAGDFAAVVEPPEQGRQYIGLRILAYCFMHNPHPSLN